MTPNYFVEHRRTVVRSGPPKYVPLADIDNYTGFRGVYAVTEAVAKHIAAQGHVGNLQGVPVYSDTLFVDFDSEAGVTEFAKTLSRLHVRFEMYATGRRGTHFHVPIVPMWGTNVPNSQLAWVEANATGEWDRTIYRQASIIRLDGTWHEKNPGNRKQLSVSVISSNTLEIPLLPPEAGQHTPVSKDADKTSTDFWAMIYTPKGSPGRNFRLYSIARTAAELGMEENTARKAAEWWAHNRAQPPLPVDSEFTRIWRNGFGI